MLSRTFLSLLALGTVPLGYAQSQQDPYPITGAPLPSDGQGVPARRNIDDLQAAGGPEWDLYIRALVEMQKTDYRDPLSYFQIAGIHGAPFIQWNNTGGQVNNNWIGYCPHGEELFLPWHRPMVILFEQVLVSHAKRLARAYPGKHRQEYMRAADRLRSPYWDWAANSNVPSATVPAQVTVKIPNGQSVQERRIDNPLYTYNIPQAVLNGEYGRFDPQNRRQVSRCASPQRYPQTANEFLGSRQFRQWTVSQATEIPLLSAGGKAELIFLRLDKYDAFTRAANFRSFATESNNLVSLEVIHNNVHSEAACGHHFTEPEVAAFDPLFMLHHTQVDRLYAFWQVLRPDEALFKGTYRGQARFATASGTNISPKSPLEPFFAKGRQPHTPESVQNILDFGYTYPELKQGTKSTQELQRELRRVINRLYSSRGSGQRRRRQLLLPTRRYFVHVRFDRAQVPGPCVLNISVREKEVASLAISVQPTAGIMMAGVPLDVVLESKELQGLSEAAIFESLLSELSVKIFQLDGSVISVPSLEVELEDVQVIPPTSDDEFPQYGDSRTRPVASN